MYCHRPQSCPQSYCALNCIVLRIVLISPSIVSPSIVPYHRHGPHVHCIALNCIISPSIGIVDTALNCIVLNNCLVLNRPQSYRITIVLNRIISSSIASYRPQSYRPQSYCPQSYRIAIALNPHQLQRRVSSPAESMVEPQSLYHLRRQIGRRWWVRSVDVISFEVRSTPQREYEFGGSCACRFDTAGRF